MDKETTSTNPNTGEEEYKDTDLSRIEKIKRRTLAVDGTDLSDEDLLALLVCIGYDKCKATQIALNLLHAFDKNLITLFTASIEQLTKVKGIGFVKACQIKAAFELIKRTASYSEEEHPKIQSTDDVIHLLAPHMKYLKQEEFRVLLLDSKNRLTRYQTVSLGALDKALVEPRDVFRPAIRAHAKSIILVHNHPSGDPTPSKNDVELTVKLSLSGEILGINVLDHIIIGFSNHVSLKDKELM